MKIWTDWGIYDPQKIITINAKQANSVYAGDLDGDNDTDILSTSFYYVNPNDGKINWYENIDGQGNYGSQQIISSPDLERPCAVTAFDIDDDGDSDVLSASRAVQYQTQFGNGRLAWYENDGQGNFGAPQNIAIINGNSGSGAYSLYAIDLDNDGDKDIISGIVENYISKIVWYENQGQGAFGTAKIISSNEGSTPIYPTDINGDGYMDLVSFTTGNNEDIIWYENLEAQGGFASSQTIQSNVGDRVRSIFATDLEGDGDMDVLSTTFFNGEIKWHENTNGQGAFAVPQVISTNVGGAIAVSATDINGDGKMDVLSAAQGTPTFPNEDKIIWHENMGLASITESKYHFFSIYPNPTTGILKIKSKISISKIEVYNQLGQQILSNSGKTQIDLSKLSSGIYFLKIIGTNGKSGTTKIIKH